MAAAAATALSLGACASAPEPPIYDLTAAKPSSMRPFRAQIQIAQPVATLDLDSDRILVRDGLNLSLLPGGRWPQQLSSLFRAPPCRDIPERRARPLACRRRGEG